MTLEQKIEALENLKLSQSFDWHYILNEHITDYNDLIEELENQSLMQVEIIYYTNAIDYLKEHDPSLQTSMSLALELEMDFSNNSFSSETLASILATQHLYDELSENHDAINEILEDDAEESIKELYDVDVSRESTRVMTFSVEATNLEEAETIAIEKARKTSFGECSEFAVNYATECDQ